MLPEKIRGRHQSIFVAAQVCDRVYATEGAFSVGKEPTRYFDGFVFRRSVFSCAADLTECRSHRRRGLRGFDRCESCIGDDVSPRQQRAERNRHQRARTPNRGAGRLPPRRHLLGAFGASFCAEVVKNAQNFRACGGLGGLRRFLIGNRSYTLHAPLAARARST